MMTSFFVAIYYVHNSRGENDKNNIKIFKCVINVWCPLKKMSTNDK